MSDTSFSQNSLIEVPLIAAYAACLMEEGTSTNIYSSLLDSITKYSNSKQKQYTDFNKLVINRQDSLTIPFVKNSLDQGVLIASTPRKSNPIFKVFSDASNVSLGYLIIYEDKFIYRDRPHPDIEDDKNITEVLNSEKISFGIKELLSLEKNDDFAYTPENGETLINFHAPSLSSCFNYSDSVYIELFIIRNDESDNNKSIKRNLSVSTLNKINQNNFSIGLPPSQTMELHAASIYGHCLMVESPNKFRILFDLPDLTEPNSRSYLKIDPIFIFNNIFGLYNPEKIFIDFSVAHFLYNKYKWFTFSSLDYWFTIHNNT